MPDQVTRLNFNGINKDISSYEVDPNKWTDGNNIEFDNDKTKKILGHKQVFGTLSGTPYFLLYHRDFNDDYWIYADLDKIYTANQVSGSTTHTDVTRTSGGDYSASAATRWGGGVLGGVVILNNGVDVPQMKGTSASNFSDLSNWDSNHTCKVIKPFKRHLVALDMTESSTRYPFRVRWSHPAEGGTVPITWDETDATKDAGYVDLSQTSGIIKDCVPLRDSNIIYKEDSVWSMNYVGGTAIFSFTQIFPDAGILSKDCAKAFEGGHFVVGEDDVYIHNGQTRQSVVDTQIRDELFGLFEPDYKDRTFVVPDYEKNEMHICFVSVDNTTDAFADKAFTYNWRNQSWSIRDLPHITYAAWGIVDETDAIQWDTSDYWNSTTESWNVPLKSSIALADANNDKIYVQGSTNQFNGTNFRAFAERTNLDLGYQGTKAVKKIVPVLGGTGSVDFYVGYKYISNEATTWKGPYTFTPGTHSHIPVRATGNYVGVRLESTSNNTWALDNLEIHWSPQGSRARGKGV